jgi:hypothetical protein
MCTGDAMHDVDDMIWSYASRVDINDFLYFYVLAMYWNGVDFEPGYCVPIYQS